MMKARNQLSPAFPAASCLYFSIVRSSTMPHKNKMFPQVVDLPASTWPMKTTLRCGLGSGIFLSESFPASGLTSSSSSSGSASAWAGGAAGASDFFSLGSTLGSTFSSTLGGGASFAFTSLLSSFSASASQSSGSSCGFGFETSFTSFTLVPSFGASGASFFTSFAVVVGASAGASASAGSSPRSKAAARAFAAALASSCCFSCFSFLSAAFLFCSAWYWSKVISLDSCFFPADFPLPLLLRSEVPALAPNPLPFPPDFP
mmetsp:Transcript_61090/g.133754  ORF Transcript_61090/g.133754 Transcript_61090/m.133754 type:complete len:260 (+) Transcript_61090:706-1485(+)